MERKEEIIRDYLITRANFEQLPANVSTIPGALGVDFQKMYNTLETHLRLLEGIADSEGWYTELVSAKLDTTDIVIDGLRYQEVRRLQEAGLYEYQAVAQVLGFTEDVNFSTTSLGTSSNPKEGLHVHVTGPITYRLIEEPEYLDVHEAAALIGTTEKNLRKQLRSGVFEAKKVGNEWWVRRSSLLNK